MIRGTIAAEAGFLWVPSYPPSFPMNEIGTKQGEGGSQWGRRGLDKQASFTNPKHKIYSSSVASHTLAIGKWCWERDGHKQDKSREAKGRGRGDAPPTERQLVTCPKASISFSV